jgi:hypothetical protein
MMICFDGICIRVRVRIRVSIIGLLQKQNYLKTTRIEKFESYQNMSLFEWTFAI